MARRANQTIKSRAKSKAKARITSIKITKTNARNYKQLADPNYKVRMVRHGKKPADYFLDVSHQSNERVDVIKNDPGQWGLRIAKTKTLKSGQITETDLPFNRMKIQEFLAQAEKNPDAINALKAPDEYFAFTLEDNQTRTSFIDVRFALQVMRQYLATGSKDAKISLFRLKGTPDTWRKNFKKVRTTSETQKARRNVRERLKRYVKKRYHGEAYTAELERSRTRMQKMRERIYANEKEHEQWKKKERNRWRKKQKAIKRAAIKANQEKGKRATAQRRKNRNR